MAWAKTALIIASTLASSRFQSFNVEPGLCYTGSVSSACSPMNGLYRPEHVIFPLIFPAVFVVVMHAPTLFLASRWRLCSLWTATWRLFLIFLTIRGSAEAYLQGYRTVAYALALHFSLFFLCRKRGGLSLFSDAAYTVLQYAALAVLILGVWHCGPPLPIWDVPGMPGCCGAASHMLAWGLSETMGGAVLFVEGWWRGDDLEIKHI